MRRDDAYAGGGFPLGNRGSWDDSWDREDEDDYEGYRRRRNRRRNAQPRYPVFCLVLFILDIVFCGVRLLLVPFGIIGASILRQQNPHDPLLDTLTYEVAANAAIGITGMAAAVLMLLRVRFGMYLGGLTVLGVLASVGVGVWQAGIQFGAAGFEPGTPEYVARIVGMGGVLAVRVVLLLLYVGALVVFARMPAVQAASERGA